MNIKSLGWNDEFESHLNSLNNDNYTPGRIIREHRKIYIVETEQGQLQAEVSGRFMHAAKCLSDFPAVGDWVALSVRPDEKRATIHARLPRKSSFSRKAVLSGSKKTDGGKTDEQVLAANIDKVFLVCGLDDNFNIRRIERYLSIAWDSGANPVIVLNKADVCPDVEACLEEVESVAIGVTILTVSAIEGSGLDQLRTCISPGKTAVFLGSSGVGKSTLINRLLGEDRLDTGGVRIADSRGRHTTIHRELIVLPSGGIVIDTPGLREIQAFGDEEGLSRTFSDIEELASHCRFADCQHQNEPGCAVRNAISSGELDESRFNSYLKLQKELAHLERRKDVKAQRQLYRERDKKYRQHSRENNELRKKGLA
ncbi:MAG: ribosome small subunit-dependent GTPase A [candidate division Zixibacteria bacterium]